MKYEKVIIKQIPDDDNGTAFGLGKYGKSRFPKCSDTIQASGLSDGRFITGLDPNGPELSLIKDYDLREEKRQEREDLSNSLKSILPRIDLSPSSPFWETFYIHISTDQDLVLNKTNPLDVVKYHVLVANGFAAPTKDDIGTPMYRECKYYCHVDEVEEKEKVSSQKLRDKASAELSKISENKEYMTLIGKYLEGTKVKDRMLTDTLYGCLSDYIQDKKTPENVEKFLKAMKISREDLQFKVTIDSALRKKLIRFKEGQYTRGGVNLGKTILDVYKNLKLPEYANEFIQIHDEINGN